MADVKTPSINDYVKWTIANGGIGIGKILSLKDKDLAVVETPTGSICELAIANLLSSSEDDYESNVEEIVTNINRRKRKPKDTAKAEEEVKMTKTEESKACEGMAQTIAALETKVKAMQDENDSYSKKMKDAEDKAKSLDEEYAKMKDDMGKAEKALAEAAAKVNQMEKASLAQVRFAEMKEVDAVASIDVDEVKAKAELAEMSASTYATVLKVAKASFGKLTDQTKTNLPKATDQSVTDKTKLTQAKAEEEAQAVKAVEDAVKNAKLEKDATLETVASAGDAAKNLLGAFAEQSLARNKGGKKTKKE